MKAEEMLVEFSNVMTKEHEEIVGMLGVNKEVHVLENKVEELQSTLKWVQRITWAGVTTLATALPFVLWIIYSDVQTTNVELASAKEVLTDTSNDLDRLRNDIRNIFTTQDTTYGLIARIDKLQEIIVRKIDE